MTLSAKAVSLTTELPGRTSPFRVAEVRPQVNGIVQKRLYTEGGDVKAGQQLYQIDPALYQATLDSQKAALARAQAQQKTAALLVERYKLVATRAVSQQTYDNAHAPRATRRRPMCCRPRPRWTRRASTWSTPRCCRPSTASLAAPR